MDRLSPLNQLHSHLVYILAGVNSVSAVDTGLSPAIWHALTGGTWRTAERGEAITPGIGAGHASAGG
jgi:hypothetical protein